MRWLTKLIFGADQSKSEPIKAEPKARFVVGNRLYFKRRKFDEQRERFIQQVSITDVLSFDEKSGLYISRDSLLICEDDEDVLSALRARDPRIMSGKKNVEKGQSPWDPEVAAEDYQKIVEQRYDSYEVIYGVV